MSNQLDDTLLARLARGEHSLEEADGLAASRPEQGEDSKSAVVAEDNDLDAILKRINSMADGEPSTAKAVAAEAACDDANTFVPVEPESFYDAQLTDTEVESLALKYLLARGNITGRGIADQVKLPFVLVNELLCNLKNEQLLVHRGSAPMNDYEYQLTDLGRERARRYSVHCTYFGSAPVSLGDYVASVKAQSLAGQRIKDEDLQRAFSDLLINKKMFSRLGPAMNSGRGLFLFGAPGNGKTSIAERVTRAFGRYVWIPRAIGIDGEIVRVFDPVSHVEKPLADCEGLYDQRHIDRRWVQIERPTIIAGGELTMEALEVTINRATGICEAPLQLKSNCGTLVIDDFGRQRMRIDELLNRWILPLEKRYDFLSLPNGKKIEVPFDQLIVFSTNLEPRDLVDEAFLRRIPYKIEVIDPSEEEFRELFSMMAKQLGIELAREPLDYLIKEHYQKVGRSFRCCHPRDLLMQVKSFCVYMDRSVELTSDHIDVAVENYFAVM